MGKPKLTKELVKRAVELKERGLSNQDICIACGISETAFYRWQQHPKSELQMALVEGLKKAEALYKDALLYEILQAGKDKDWKAHAWLLERKYPEEFGRVDRMKAEIQAESKTEVNIIIEE